MHVRRDNVVEVDNILVSNSGALGKIIWDHTFIYNSHIERWGSRGADGNKISNTCFCLCNSTITCWPDQRVSSFYLIKKTKKESDFILN